MKQIEAYVAKPDSGIPEETTVVVKNTRVALPIFKSGMSRVFEGKESDGIEEMLNAFEYGHCLYRDCLILQDAN